MRQSILIAARAFLGPRSSFDGSSCMRLALTAAAFLLARDAASQSLADRVEDARADVVQFSYPAREGVCGDGESVVGFGRTLHIWPSIESHGSWSGVDCVPGPVRVRLALDGGQVTAIRTHVGEPRRGGAGRVSDLGSVSAREAADYLLSLAARLDGKPAADAIFSAVLADAGRIGPALLRIARDPSRPREARKRAITWVGRLGEEGAVRSLDAIAGDAGFDADLREHALAALAFVPDGGGVESLVRLARGGGEMRMRRKATFWLGNADDPRARRVLRDLAQDDAAPTELRGEAIFALGHLDATPEDGAFLRAVYPRLPDELREKAIQSLAQTGKEDPESLRWLLSRVEDEDESLEARKKALFWAAQQDETPIGELVRLYPRLREGRLKEHYAFVLSQRDERAATDELIRIARSDPDQAVRRKAIFWLGQRDDPRAAAFIRDAILKPND